MAQQMKRKMAEARQSQATSPKATSQRACVPASLCFEVFIKTGAGLSESVQRRLERDYDDWLSERGLSFDGALLRRQISAPGRDMTRQDQLDVLLWLQQEGQRLGCPMNVWLSELVRSDGSNPQVSEPGTWGWHGDAALGHLLALYAMGRLGAGTVMDCLRGEG